MTKPLVSNIASPVLMAFYLGVKALVFNFTREVIALLRHCQYYVRKKSCFAQISEYIYTQYQR